MRTVMAMVALVLLAVPAAAQEEAGSVDDPSCEEDPFQTGCDEACAGPQECPHPPCPTDLAGYAPQTGGVFMSWTLNSESDVKVYRAEAGEEFVEVAHLAFPSTRWIDHDTEEGATYRYQVSAADERGESPPCGMLEVTTVPSFPSLLAGVAAGTIAVLGYVGLRRRP